MAHTPKEGILKDLLFGVQVLTKGQEHHEKVDGVVVDKPIRVALKKDPSKPTNAILQKDLKVEDPRSLVSTLFEELPTNKFRLSPLAARAALASLVSTAQGDNDVDGAKEFGSCITKKLFVVNDLSSEEPSSTSVQMFSEIANGIKEGESCEKASILKPQLEQSSGRKGKKAKVESKTLEVNDSSSRLTCTTTGSEVQLTDLPRTGRVTRSAIRRVGDDVNNDIQIQSSSAESTQQRSSNTRRFTRSTAVEEKEDFTVKPDMKDDNLMQTTKLDNGNVDYSVQIQCCAENSQRRMARRFTRSAVLAEKEEFTVKPDVKDDNLVEKKSSDSGNLKDDIQIQSSAENTRRTSSTARRYTRSTANLEKEDLTVKPDMEDNNLIQTGRPNSSKRSRVKRCIGAQEDEVESSKTATGESVNRKLPEFPITGRVTRSAVRRAAGNASNDEQLISCAQDTLGKGSTNTQMSTVCTDLGKRENLVIGQDLDDHNMIHNTESDESEPNNVSKEAFMVHNKGPLKKKIKEQSPDSIENTKQAEGKEGHKRKSISTARKQERHSSERLLLGRRTRSQSKS